MSSNSKNVPSDEEEIDLGIDEEDVNLIDPQIKSRPRSFRARICEKLSRLFVKKRYI